MACVRNRRGVWTLDYRDQNGVRHWEQTRWAATEENRLKAEKLLARRAVQVEDGSYEARRDAKTFEQLIKAFRAALVVRDATREDYELIIKRLLEFFGPTRKVRTINVQDVEEYRAWAQKQPSRRGPPMSVATVNKDLMLLGALFNYAEKHRWVAFNPAAARHVKRLQQSREARRRQLDGNTFTTGEVQGLLDAARPGRDRTLFRLAVESGMRMGELLALRWEDIDWTNSRLYVRRSYRKGVESDPKTAASERSIGLTPTMVSELRVWKLACPQPPGSRGLVFPNADGGYERNLLPRVFNPALRRAGLRKIRFHDLRHTCGSWLIAAGLGVKEVQAHLGHASAQVTLNIYSHLLPGAHTASAATMDRLMGGSKTVATGTCGPEGAADIRLPASSETVRKAS